VGSYVITTATGSFTSVNYSLTFVNGTLSITAIGTAAKPTFTPNGGNFSSAQRVSIADTTPGAVIHYTTNGTAPTTSSTVYSTAISVKTTETIKAIAVAQGYNSSAVASAIYTIQ